jgi:hypothetical protein
VNAADKSYFDSKFSGLSNKVERIERGVYGDRDNNQLGLIERDEDKEQRIRTLEKERDRIRWVATGLGMAAAGATKLLIFVVEQLTK